MMLSKIQNWRRDLMSLRSPRTIIVLIVLVIAMSFYFNYYTSFGNGDMGGLVIVFIIPLVYIVLGFLFGLLLPTNFSLMDRVFANSKIIFANILIILLLLGLFNLLNTSSHPNSSYFNVNLENTFGFAIIVLGLVGLSDFGFLVGAGVHKVFSTAWRFLSKK